MMDASEDGDGKIEVLPSTETDAGAAEGGLSEAQWTAIRAMLDSLMAHRTEE